MSAHPLQPSELYEAFDDTIRNVEDLYNAIQGLEKWIARAKPGSFVWRGVGDASHAFNSSLFRRVWWTNARRKKQSLDDTPPPTEGELYESETRILADAHRWGLHDTDRGRLSVLRQLAALQHNHAPTRLIDVSLNPYIAAWFAVEQDYDPSGDPAADSEDGRIFAIGTRDRLINEDSEERSWEDNLRRPWRKERTKKGGTRWTPEDWRQNTRVWIPAPAERRIAAQHGAFLLGGAPSVKQFPRSTHRNDWLSAEDARRATSVPLRFHKLDPKRGGVVAEGSPVYTWRIEAAAKASIREHLETRFGYGTSRIYPDYPGFGKFGTPWLATDPP
ncbi:MAG: FRG domain-containing protein [Actinomycetota bacterium]